MLRLRRFLNLWPRVHRYRPVLSDGARVHYRCVSCGHRHAMERERVRMLTWISARCPRGRFLRGWELMSLGLSPEYALFDCHERPARSAVTLN